MRTLACRRAVDLGLRLLKLPGGLVAQRASVRLSRKPARMTCGSAQPGSCALAASRSASGVS